MKLFDYLMSLLTRDISGLTYAKHSSIPATPYMGRKYLHHAVTSPWHQGWVEQISG